MTEPVCVFCQIIRREVPASVVYEDEQLIVFLSNHPVNEGHALVVTKKHVENIYEVTEDEAAYLFKIAKRMAHAVKDATDVEGIRIVQNNGKDAGQIIFYLHVHVIPMKPNNHLQHENGFRTREQLEADAEKIKQHLKSLK